MTAQEIPSKSTRAAAGVPDKTFGWQTGPLFIPYLSFSLKEMDDLYDMDIDWAGIIGKSKDQNFPAEEFGQLVRTHRIKRAAYYGFMFRRRLGIENEDQLSNQYIYENFSEETLADWRKKTMNGGVEPSVTESKVMGEVA